MAKSTEARVFAPNPSRQESKASTTSSTARAILEAEAKARDVKTAKLRALRLKQEADTPPPAAKPAPKKRAAKA